MLDIVVSILFIYIFILAGFIIKKLFKDEINEKTVSLVAVYALQPLLVFWGLTFQGIDWSFVYTPLFFGAVSLIGIIFAWGASKYFLHDEKYQAIFRVNGVIGNTGNLGITLGFAIIGPGSIPYTSLINLMMMVFSYTFGVYYYSRGKFSVKKSIKHVFKMPVMWAMALAIIANMLDIKFSVLFGQILEMGAHASLVVSLMLIGLYLASVKLRYMSYKIILPVALMKFGIMPLLGIIGLMIFKMPTTIGMIIIMELLMPPAVNNVNFAALFDCKPLTVTEVVFVNSLISIIAIPLGLAFYRMVLG